MYKSTWTPVGTDEESTGRGKFEINGVEKTVAFYCVQDYLETCKLISMSYHDGKRFGGVVANGIIERALDQSKEAFQ